MDPKTPDTPLDLPLQPTGSGVADLEIAYEQMRLADAADLGEAEADSDVTADRADLKPLDSGEDTAESAAHPS